LSDLGKSVKHEYHDVPGYWEEEFPNGWVSVWYHYSSHPDKRSPEWKAEMSKGYPGGVNGSPWMAEMEIDFGARSGSLVCPSWRREVHLVKPFDLNPDWPRYRAIDPGLHNPFACLWGCLSPDKILYLYREHYKAGWTISQHAQYIRGATGRERIDWTVIDPSATARTLASPRSISDQLAEQGIICVPGDNRIEDGLEAINEWLLVKDVGLPNVLVFDNLHHFISEIEGYRFEIQTPEQAAHRDPREIPIKKNDHLMDAFRYMIMSMPEYSKTARMIGIKKLSHVDRAMRQIKRTRGPEDDDDLSN